MSPTAPEVTSTAAPEPEAPALDNVPSYADIYFMVNVTCANVVCHVPGGFMPDLSDANDDQYDILMSWTVDECGGVPLVAPGEPEGSAILRVTTRDACGDLFMPKDCPDDACLSDENREALTTWIAAGAPR
jgi:hypothetical protein